MDEYIKRSEVVDLIEDKLERCETVLEVLDFASLRTSVMGLRSADVAPRAEVNEAYWEGVEYGNKDGAALVAREIFEEIEKYNRKPLPECEPAYIIKASEFAALKKKYTGVEPPEGVES